MLLETLAWECVSSSCCGSRWILPRVRSSPTTCCITALISMKATGKINKRAQRKWFFFSEKRPCSVLAELQNLPCSLYLLLASASSLHPLLSPAHQTKAAASKVSRRQHWFVVMATQFSMSTALTWGIVKNVDGSHQRSVKKRPWTRKSGSSGRLLNAVVPSLLHHHPVAGLFIFTFYFTTVF